MNLMQMFCIKRSVAVKLLMIVLLFPAISMLSQMHQTYYDIQETRIRVNYNIQHIKMAKWDIIENTISENIDKAKIQSNGAKKLLTARILHDYSGNMQTLREDLARKDNSPVFEAMNEVIDGMYINNESELNRMIIVDKNGILADKGIVSSTKKSRDWITEIQAKPDRVIAAKAVNMILTKNNNIIYLKVDAFISVDHEPFDPNMTTFKAAYDRYGINIFRNYNILVPSYITNDGDIFSVPDVNTRGIKNENNKLIIVQEFNIYDAIIKNKDDLDKYDAIVTEYEKDLRATIDSKIFSFIFSIFITMLSFIGILVSANVFIKWGGDDALRCDKRG